ncbi:tripartite tricarboxylate transporter substrate binding protein [Orrella sp. JC864]|uniref:Bug family tripartite tricarboxylate transporter substrate binding protein n=1 Tax=Orrella sp. JC864 TaxID=3120298 RepID=UPI0012BC74D9
MNRRHAIGLAGALLAAAFLSSPAAAGQDFPNRPVTVIVPYPPGQASDLIMRLISAKAAKSLGQPVVVENRAGASGNIGTDVGARAPKDGYTLTLATAALPISANTYDNLPFDLRKDFAPVLLMTAMPLVLVTAPESGLRDVKTLVEQARARPGAITFASSGPGTSHHLTGELFKARSGLDMLHVPYKGSSPAHVDLMGGRVDVMFDNIVAVRNNVREGKLRALAVTSPQRSPSLPDVPTLREAGYEDMDTQAWFGLLVPAGTPEPAIARLNEAFAQALSDPDIQSRLADMGARVTPGTPQAFGQFIEAEIEKWRPVVERAGIKMQ